VSTTAIVRHEELDNGLKELRLEVAVLKVSDAASYAAAGALLTRVRHYQKTVKSTLQAFVDLAKRNLDGARQQMNVYMNPAEEIDATISRAMNEYKMRERMAAEAEERRINEERRLQAEADAKAREAELKKKAEEDRRLREKEIAEARKAGDIGQREAGRLTKQATEAAERQNHLAELEAHSIRSAVQDVKVAPAVPTVAGLRQRVNWKFKVTDINRIPRAYLMVNDVAIGQMVRMKKNKQEAEKECPGIEVSSEDSI
jgi:hypothetical protein